MEYTTFLTQKTATAPATGFDVPDTELGAERVTRLRPDQRAIVRWALRRGRAALFLETGYGKSRILLEWAALVAAHSGRKVLVLTPLAVAFQTVEEGQAIEVAAAYVRSQAEADAAPEQVIVTNYDMVDAFDPGAFAGVVLDESSILKAFSGATRKKLQRLFEATPYKLCSTATPAPNDHMELSNHAEFLGVMSGAEMLARWFINDSMKAENYRLKHHARADFWRWVTSWAVCATSPADLGYPADGFDLPGLTLTPHIVAVDHARAQAEGKLFVSGTHSATGLWKEKAATVADRCRQAYEIVRGDVLCGPLNRPSDAGSAPQPTPSTGRGATRRGTAKTPSADASTCGATTSPTVSDGTTTTPGAGSSATPAGASAASATPDRGGSGTPASPATPSSGTPSGSGSSSTSGSSRRRAAGAPSAAPSSATDGGDGSPSITATIPGESAGSSALAATSGSGSSATIPGSSPAPSPTFRPDHWWVVWCDTNEEQDLLEDHFADSATSLRGSDSIKVKEERLKAWMAGEYRILITKSDIFGYGMNWQHVTRMCFVGITYSYEKLYQSLRRAWRYGQRNEVIAHLIYAESEGNVIDTIRRKQDDHAAMQREMVAAQRVHHLNEDAARVRAAVEEDRAEGAGWRLFLGDCVTSCRHLQDGEVDLSVFSPPFAELYTYSDSEADMGNSRDAAEFFAHFQFLIPELLRITRPGRLVVVHCKDLPTYKNRHGASGLYDFPGALVQAFEETKGRPEASEQGYWQFHSRVTIWKDPVIEAQRTNNHGLLFRNFSDRAEVVRQGMADYLLVFRKWAPEMPEKQVQQRRKVGDYVGTSPPPAGVGDERDYAIAVWQRYASPVWFDIDQTDVLNYQIARDDSDEKHICPLQLGVIRRAIDLWSNEGDLVFSPFAGVGSEGYVALQMGRKFAGVELKRSYWRLAQKYLADAAFESAQPTFFDLLEAA